MSAGEIRSRFESVAQRFGDVDKRLDRMAPLDLVASENGHLRDQIADARLHAKEQIVEVDRASRERDEDLEKTAMAAVKSVADAGAAARTELTAAVAEVKRDKQTTWGWVLQVIGFAVAIAAAVIAARGIH